MCDTAEGVRGHVTKVSPGSIGLIHSLNHFKHLHALNVFTSTVGVPAAL